MKFSLNTKYFINTLEYLLQKLWESNEEFYPIYKIWTFFICLVTLLHPVDIEVNDHETKAEYIFISLLFPLSFQTLIKNIILWKREDIYNLIVGTYEKH